MSNPNATINQVIGRSAAIIQMCERIKSVAITNAPVLISGESGVGKELVANMIHQESNRASEPLVIVNCASIPRELFESEFFGHIKGAFTGADKDRKGRFELANKGTLFLDEIGEIPIDLQGKLLRALQQQSFERIGSDITLHVDVRIISASNRALDEEVEKNRFREDLYYRLSTFPISVPPLRKRKEDIPLLAQHFYVAACKEFNKSFSPLSGEQLAMLGDYSWPGNIRELKSVVERAVILSKDHFRLDSALPDDALKQISQTVANVAERIPETFLSENEFRQLERKNLIAALECAQWKVSGSKGAAVLLGMKPTTLTSRIQALGIKSPINDVLYSRLGGYSAISIFVDELIPRLRADPELGRFWKNRGIDSIRKEKQYLVEYLCQATGGPHHYTGRHMHKAHEGLYISEDDWKILFYLLAEVALLLNIKDKELFEIKQIFNEIKPTIVGV